MTADSYCLGIEKVRAFLPHRYPFLFIDRVLEIHPTGDVDDFENDQKTGLKVVALKNFTYNEPFVPGHFPDFSVVPGVILIETMAQAASFSIYPYVVDKNGNKKDFQVFLVGVDSARFRKPVVPGDTFKIESLVTKKRGRLWMFQCKGFVDGNLVAEAELMANLVLTP